MTFQIHTQETNQRQYRAVLGDAELRHALAKLVADKAGIDLTAKNVTYKVRIEESNRGSIGPDFNHQRAIVEITEDFGPAKE